MSWLPRPFPPAVPAQSTDEDQAAKSTEDASIRTRPRFLPALDLVPFFACQRGLYRIFNAAQYRFYWSNSAPPVAGTSPQATNSTLAFTTSTTFADGTWYVSVSYFDGVLDSGFLPLGPNGQTYLAVEISGGVIVATRPSQPSYARLVVLPGGVVALTAYYNSLIDGASRATQWAINYTTTGATPANNAPNLTQAMSSGPFQVLTYNLPAQPNGTTVKVELQTYNGGNYSLPLTVLIATASTAGPTAPLGLQSWPGFLPEGV